MSFVDYYLDRLYFIEKIIDVVLVDGCSDSFYAPSTFPLSPDPTNNSSYF